MPTKSIDRIDLKILRELQNNGRISNLELSESVGLSPSPCLRRVKQLEADGTIKRYSAIVDAATVGLPISVFVSLSLKQQERADLDSFESAIISNPEVMECYLMTGDSDYLLRIVVPDLETYERFLTSKLTRIPGVANIQSSFALKQIIYRTSLPIEIS